MLPGRFTHSVSSVCALALLSVVAAAEPRLDRLEIRRTIIEAPNGTNTAATDMNNAGVVVGIYNSPNARGFAWSPSGGLVDLAGVAEADFSLAWAVNECGQVVGELQGHAALWNTIDEVEDLGTLGGDASVARGINDRGDVVGYSQIIRGGRAGPFIWTESEGMRPIECPGSSGVATGINNAREVVGVCDDAQMVPHAFFWSEDTGRIDFPARPEHTSTSALAINDRGEVTGTATVRAPVYTVRAFKWTPRNQRVVYLRRLGDFFDVTDDINRFGWVAGAAVNTGEVRHAAVWIRPRIGFLLDPGLGVSSSAYAINDLGSVAGTIVYDDRSTRAVVWEPPALVKRALRQRGIERCLRP